MSEAVDVVYIKKRLARLKHDLANWAALEQSHKEAIQESRRPGDKASSEAELRRVTQMIANVKHEVAELEKILKSTK